MCQWITRPLSQAYQCQALVPSLDYHSLLVLIQRQWTSPLKRRYESTSNRIHTWYGHMNNTMSVTKWKVWGNILRLSNQFMVFWGLLRILGRWYKKYLHVWSAAKLLLWQYDLYRVRIRSVWNGMTQYSNGPINFSNLFNLARTYKTVITFPTFPVKIHVSHRINFNRLTMPLHMVV